MSIITSPLKELNRTDTEQKLWKGDMGLTFSLKKILVECMIKCVIYVAFKIWIWYKLYMQGIIDERPLNF